jgi:hypothetical protein
MPTTGVDLEVVLSWVPSANGFLLNVLYNAPGDRDDYRYFGDKPVPIDLKRLQALSKADVDDYGLALGEMLFPDAARGLLHKAVVASNKLPVHLRLVIDPRAPADYQAIRWETLCQPGSRLRLATTPRIRFSRFLSEAESLQPTPLPRAGELRALIAVANPSNVAGFVPGPVPLGNIQVTAEVERAREALVGIEIVSPVLSGEGGDPARRATRENLLKALRKDVHLLYLVCHGRITEDGHPQLLLEKPDGKVDLVDGTAFASDVASLDRVPAFVVLCSCQSAGRDHTGYAAIDEPDEPRMESTAEPLLALAPALAGAGVAVVVGMQGNVTMTTAGKFLSKFFAQLNVDGVPAKAMAEARLSVRDNDDWYMPVLYSRLKRGSAWYKPRFGGKEALLFANLHTRIRATQCLPIIGTGIAGEDGVVASRQDLAREWVNRRQIPMSPMSRGDLASVAQYVRVEQQSGPRLVWDELYFLLRNELRSRHEEEMPGLDWDALPLATMFSLIGEHQRAAANREDCYSRLARLDLPLFVTTSWSNLLEDALEEYGKSPVTRYFDWRKSMPNEEPWPYLLDGETGDSSVRQSIDDLTGPVTQAGDARGRRLESHRRKVERLRAEADPYCAPRSFSIQEPLVYHLYGTLQSQKTLVITEDDYFTWLREWMKQVDNGDSIPGYVRTPLVTESLLFLGFHVDDWEFRLVFQAIKSFHRSVQEGSPHVDVQFQPHTLRIEQEAAQSYLESYFDEDKISIYWHTANAFLTELQTSSGDE